MPPAQLRAHSTTQTSPSQQRKLLQIRHPSLSCCCASALTAFQQLPGLLPPVRVILLLSRSSCDPQGTRRGTRGGELAPWPKLITQILTLASHQPLRIVILIPPVPVVAEDRSHTAASHPPLVLVYPAAPFLHFHSLASHDSVHSAAGAASQMSAYS